MKIACSLAALMVGAIVAGGCFNSREDCDINPLLGCGKWGTGSSGTGGQDGGPPPGCVPSQANGPVGADCGVFVSPAGSDANDGSQDKPALTIGHALSIANGKPVYACAGGTPYQEALIVPAGSVIFGGVDCSDWSYVGVATKSKLTAAADKVPLTLAMGTGTEIHDLNVVATAAVAAGGSSIAVIANQVEALLDGCVIEAGDAMAGVAGAPFSMAAMGGVDGKPGVDACMADQVFGGAPVVSMCGNPDSISGSGGNGQTVSGGAGSPGLPNGAMNAGQGEGAVACTPGTKGDDGMPGGPGIGATGLGGINASGYTGVVGGAGLIGKVAQGGGGGGGAKGGTGANQCSAGMAGGASGGSGGSGGCGGAGGKGGNPGGSSIALMSLDATLTFINVSLGAGNGGAGGDGGQGQDGGNGGSPGAGGKATGLSLNPGCAGGAGGFGGKGGKGGGGTGGHSIALAYMGKAPPMAGVTFAKGMAGMGGVGDNSNGNSGDGAAGVAADMQVFP